jgi:hypothetical protein
MPMPVDPLEPILARAATDNHLLHRAELEAVSRAISRHDPDEFIYAATRVCALTWDNGQARPPGFFEIHSQHWWIDLSAPGNQQQLLTVAIAAVLVDALDLTLSTSWVTQVLSTAVSIESATVADSRLRIRLRCHVEPQLSSHLQDDINPADYADFIQAITSTAGTEHDFAGGIICFTSQLT